MKKLLLFFIAACAFTASAIAADLTWVFAGTHSYEAQSPGLGSSSRFNAKAGWADVYVYDLRTPGWQQGTQAFNDHFDSTVEEVRYVAQRGIYKDLQMGEPADVTIAGVPFRTVAFQFSRDGRTLQSYTYLTARGGKLLKYRISFFAEANADGQAESRAFVEQNLKTDPTAGSV